MKLKDTAVLVNVICDNYPRVTGEPLIFAVPGPAHEINSPFLVQQEELAAECVQNNYMRLITWSYSGTI